ncbi:MAG: MoaD/ThiS family protein [Kofleriaceae bacterium]
MATIRIPSALRQLVQHQSEIDVEAATVRDAITALEAKHPTIAGKLLADGALKPYIRIYVGPDDITALQGLDTAVTARDEISIIPAIAGG